MLTAGVYFSYPPLYSDSHFLTGLTKIDTYGKINAPKSFFQNEPFEEFEDGTWKSAVLKLQFKESILKVELLKEQWL